MSARSSRFRSRIPLFAWVCGFGAGVGILAAPSEARGQACCAGTGAVTPGRLGMMDDALVGVQAKVGQVTSSFDVDGQPIASPPGAGEVDLEQDAFAALRLLEKGQVSLLVPIVETWRQSLGRSEAGGGLGDVNANVRYDFLLAGASRVFPGFAALGGVTFPTGRPADASGLGPLATGATGIGAYQINLGLAVEQSFGPWLVNATGLVAQRTSRGFGSGQNAVSETLGPQWTMLAAVAYTFDSEAALALSVSEVIEGDATINGAAEPRSGHRLFSVAVSGLLPLAPHYHLQGSLSDNPPIQALSENQPADLTLAIAAVRTWY